MATYAAGDRVDGLYDGNTDGVWYPAFIQVVHNEDPEAAYYEVLYDDGEVEEHVPSVYLRRHQRGTICVGTRVFGRYAGGDEWYPGKIQEVLDNGTFTLEYDDSEVETEVPLVYIRESMDEEPIGEDEDEPLHNDEERSALGEEAHVPIAASPMQTTVEPLSGEESEPIAHAESSPVRESASHLSEDSVDPHQPSETDQGAEEEVKFIPPPSHQAQSNSEPPTDAVAADVVDEYSSIISTMEQLEQCYMDPLATKTALSTLVKQMRAFPQVAADLVHTRGGERLIIDLLQRHQSHAVIQCYGFVLLRRLCFLCGKSTSYFLRNGIIDLITIAMRKFSEDAILQAAACGALAVFTRIHAGLTALLEHRVAHLVLTTIIFHKTYSVHTRQVHYYACEVLLELCELGDQTTLEALCGDHHIAGPSLSDLSPISLLLFLLRQALSFDDKKASCAVGTLLLCLASCHRNAASMIVSLNGLNELSMVTTKYPAEPGVQKYTATATKEIALSSMERSPTCRMQDQALVFVDEADQSLEGIYARQNHPQLRAQPHGATKSRGKPGSSNKRKIPSGMTTASALNGFPSPTHPQQMLQTVASRGNAQDPLSFSKYASPLGKTPHFPPNVRTTSQPNGSPLVILDASSDAYGQQQERKRFVASERQNRLFETYGIDVKAAMQSPDASASRTQGIKRRQLKTHLISASTVSGEHEAFHSTWAVPVMKQGQSTMRSPRLDGNPTSSRPIVGYSHTDDSYSTSRPIRSSGDDLSPSALRRQEKEASKPSRKTIATTAGRPTFQLELDGDSNGSRVMASPVRVSPQNKYSTQPKKKTRTVSTTKKKTTRSPRIAPQSHALASTESLNAYATQLFQEDASGPITSDTPNGRPKAAGENRERLSFAEKLHKMIDKAKSTLAHSSVSLATEEEVRPKKARPTSVTSSTRKPVTVSTPSASAATVKIETEPKKAVVKVTKRPAAPIPSRNTATPSESAAPTVASKPVPPKNTVKTESSVHTRPSSRPKPASANSSKAAAAISTKTPRAVATPKTSQSRDAAPVSEVSAPPLAASASASLPEDTVIDSTQADPMLAKSSEMEAAAVEVTAADAVSSEGQPSTQDHEAEPEKVESPIEQTVSEPELPVDDVPVNSVSAEEKVECPLVEKASADTPAEVTLIEEQPPEAPAEPTTEPLVESAEAVIASVADDLYADEYNDFDDDLDVGGDAADAPATIDEHDAHIHRQISFDALMSLTVEVVALTARSESQAEEAPAFTVAMNESEESQQQPSEEHTDETHASDQDEIAGVNAKEEAVPSDDVVEVTPVEPEVMIESHEDSTQGDKVTSGVDEVAIPVEPDQDATIDPKGEDLVADDKHGAPLEVFEPTDDTVVDNASFKSLEPSDTEPVPPAASSEQEEDVALAAVDTESVEPTSDECADVTSEQEAVVESVAPAYDFAEAVETDEHEHANSVEAAEPVDSQSEPVEPDLQVEVTPENDVMETEEPASEETDARPESRQTNASYADEDFEDVGDPELTQVEAAEESPGGDEALPADEVPSEPVESDEKSGENDEVSESSEPPQHPAVEEPASALEPTTEGATEEMRLTEPELEVVESKDEASPVVASPPEDVVEDALTQETVEPAGSAQPEGENVATGEDEYAEEEDFEPEQEEVILPEDGDASSSGVAADGGAMDPAEASEEVKADPETESVSEVAADNVETVVISDEVAEPVDPVDQPDDPPKEPQDEELSTDKPEPEVVASEVVALAKSDLYDEGDFESENKVEQEEDLQEQTVDESPAEAATPSEMIEQEADSTVQNPASARSNPYDEGEFEFDADEENQANSRTESDEKSAEPVDKAEDEPLKESNDEDPADKSPVEVDSSVVVLASEMDTEGVIPVQDINMADAEDGDDAQAPESPDLVMAADPLLGETDVLVGTSDTTEKTEKVSLETSNEAEETKTVEESNFEAAATDDNDSDGVPAEVEVTVEPATEDTQSDEAKEGDVVEPSVMEVSPISDPESHNDLEVAQEEVHAADSIEDGVVIHDASKAATEAVDGYDKKFDDEATAEQEIAVEDEIQPDATVSTTLSVEAGDAEVDESETMPSTPDAPENETLPEAGSTASVEQPDDSNTEAIADQASEDVVPGAVDSELNGSSLNEPDTPIPDAEMAFSEPQTEAIEPSEPDDQSTLEEEDSVAVEAANEALADPSDAIESVVEIDATEDNMTTAVAETPAEETPAANDDDDVTEANVIATENSKSLEVGTESGKSSDAIDGHGAEAAAPSDDDPHESEEGGSQSVEVGEEKQPASDQDVKVEAQEDDPYGDEAEFADEALPDDEPSAQLEEEAMDPPSSEDSTTETHVPVDSGDETPAERDSSVAPISEESVTEAQDVLESGDTIVESAGTSKEPLNDNESAVHVDEASVPAPIEVEEQHVSEEEPPPVDKSDKREQEADVNVGGDDTDAGIIEAAEPSGPDASASDSNGDEPTLEAHVSEPCLADDPAETMVPVEPYESARADEEAQSNDATNTPAEVAPEVESDQADTALEPSPAEPATADADAEAEEDAPAAVPVEGLVGDNEEEPAPQKVDNEGEATLEAPNQDEEVATTGDPVVEVPESKADDMEGGEDEKEATDEAEQHEVTSDDPSANEETVTPDRKNDEIQSPVVDEPVQQEPTTDETDSPVPTEENEEAAYDDDANGFEDATPTARNVEAASVSSSPRTEQAAAVVATDEEVDYDGGFDEPDEASPRIETTPVAPDEPLTKSEEADSYEEDNDGYNDFEEEETTPRELPSEPPVGSTPNPQVELKKPVEVEEEADYDAEAEFEQEEEDAKETPRDSPRIQLPPAAEPVTVAKPAVVVLDAEGDAYDEYDDFEE